MCSAIQPFSRPSTLARRSAWHFFAEERVAAVPGTDAPDRARLRESADEAALGGEIAEAVDAANELGRVTQVLERGFPMRVMMRRLATTYGLSVISTPTRLYFEPMGPIKYGTTYIVRPFIAPSKSGHTLARASSGLIQLLVGPASSLFFEQMNVRCSVRATSDGSERWRKLCGARMGFIGRSVPLASICCSSARISDSEPSQKCTFEGCVWAAMDWTQVSTASFFISASFVGLLPKVERHGAGPWLVV